MNKAYGCWEKTIWYIRIRLQDYTFLEKKSASTKGQQKFVIDQTVAWEFGNDINPKSQNRTKIDALRRTKSYKTSSIETHEEEEEEKGTKPKQVKPWKAPSRLVLLSYE